ncbi:MAG: hypothetical protein HKO90_06115 [Flavobacteriaceae bacterium]|nr:hypothetical protein [Flavobacteriaceae bacterium]
MESPSEKTLKSLYHSPHIMFWVSIPIVLLAGFFGREQFSLVINDSEYVASSKMLSIWISFFFALIGVIYHNLIRARIRLRKWFTLIHLFCTLDMAVAFWILSYFVNPDHQLLSAALLIIAFGQLVFLLHMLILAFSKRTPIPQQDPDEDIEPTNRTDQ